MQRTGFLVEPSNLTRSVMKLSIININHTNKVLENENPVKKQHQTDAFQLNDSTLPPEILHFIVQLRVIEIALTLSIQMNNASTLLLKHH